MLFALLVIPEWGIFMFGASILSTALCVVGKLMSHSGVPITSIADPAAGVVL